MELFLIKSFKHLSLYEKEWSTILAANQNSNPFLEFHFIYNWWRYFSDDKKIEIYSVRENQKVIAFFPFIVSKKNNVKIVQTLAIQSCPYTDFVVKKRDLDRVLMFVMDGIILDKQQAVFLINSLSYNNHTHLKLRNYMNARSFKCIEKKNNPVEILHVITPMMEVKLRALGDLQEEVVTFDQLQSLLEGNMDKFNHSSNDRLDFMKKFEGDRPHVSAKVIHLNNELIAFSYGFQWLDKYMEYGNGKLKDLFHAEKLLGEVMPIHAPGTVSILFSTKNFMGKLGLILEKRHIAKYERKQLNPTKKKAFKKKHSILIAELNDIHIKAPNCNFKSISNTEIWSGNRQRFLLNYLRGFEGYHSGNPQNTFWINSTSLYIDELNHKEKLSEGTLFIEGWESEELEKILCFTQTNYRVRNILVRVNKDNKNQIKKLILFGFQIRDKFLVPR